MKQLLLYVGITIYLFLTSTVAYYVGIKQVGLASSTFLLILFFFKITSNYSYFLKHDFKEERLVILVCILILTVEFILKDYISMKDISLFILCPVLISMLIKYQNSYDINFIRNLILTFFFIECGLAIYEKLFEINIFPYEEIDNAILLNNNSWMFRSSALLGHPLTNAVVISTILGFIIVSKFTSFFKIFSLVSGFISLLCFNARGAILIWCILGLFYLYKFIKNNKKNIVFYYFSLLLSISISLSIIYLTFNTSLGGRLLNQDKLLDGSAQTRLDVYNSFSYISSQDFWIGNSKNFIIIMNKLGAGGIENSFIVIIIKFGIIMGFLLMFSLYKLIRKFLKPYSLIQKIFIIFSFIVVGSFNNSLSISAPWVIFLLCSNTFRYNLYINKIPHSINGEKASSIIRFSN